MSDYLALYDYRCRVAAMYRARAQGLLNGVELPAVWQQFRQAREQLFATHPQSALDAEHQSVSLSFYWLDIYGGGLFLPFRDTTCPAESYGGGRYLFDTIKGSDFLPVPGEQHWMRIILDFNYAYNPSCAYNSRWTCPLAPLENRLNIPIRAGELKYTSSL